MENPSQLRSRAYERKKSLRCDAGYIGSREERAGGESGKAPFRLQTMARFGFFALFMRDLDGLYCLHAESGRGLVDPCPNLHSPRTELAFFDLEAVPLPCGSKVAAL